MFKLEWLGEIKEDGTEIYGHTVATSKTLAGVRKYANLKKLTDWEYRIEEIGYEIIHGVKVPIIINEFKIKP